jgi:hypothetical protein
MWKDGRKRGRKGEEKEEKEKDRKLAKRRTCNLTRNTEIECSLQMLERGEEKSYYSYVILLFVWLVLHTVS